MLFPIVRAKLNVSSFHIGFMTIKAKIAPKLNWQERVYSWLLPRETETETGGGGRGGEREGERERGTRTQSEFCSAVLHATELRLTPGDSWRLHEWVMSICGVLSSTALLTPETQDHGSFNGVHLYHIRSSPFLLLLFFPASEGWNVDGARMVSGEDHRSPVFAHWPYPKGKETFCFFRTGGSFTPWSRVSMGM